ncbi:hypothetical protein SSX86_031658 [Deinandra increscens subsp. villosa]|uniref:Uncharacterized protein n=1 Tax=Deinandra increscens subsp. villosa TaxID=3103831 RepID=A0AAP0C9G0_9ASTR
MKLHMIQPSNPTLFVFSLPFAALSNRRSPKSIRLQPRLPAESTGRTERSGATRRLCVWFLICSHIVHVPSGSNALSDDLLSTLIFTGDGEDNSERSFYKELAEVIEASDVILEVLVAQDHQITYLEQYRLYFNFQAAKIAFFILKARIVQYPQKHDNGSCLRCALKGSCFCLPADLINGGGPAEASRFLSSLRDSEDALPVAMGAMQQLPNLRSKQLLFGPVGGTRGAEIDTSVAKELVCSS